MKTKIPFGKYLLTITFIIYIFYIGLTNLSQFLVTFGEYLSEESIQVIELRDKFDEQYKNMLKPEGAYLKNKSAYINLNGLMAKLMGQRFMNGVYKLDNGHLESTVSYVNDHTMAVKHIESLYNAQKEQGKDFLFVVAPKQVLPYDSASQLPFGMQTNVNVNLDNLLLSLDERNIPYLDLRYSMYLDGISPADAFFTTDHHWNPRTGFWAYTKIMNYFEDNEIVSFVDSMLLDINHYNIDVYEDWMLGSQGKRTGGYFAGVDDFEVIYPKFQTNISLEIPSINYSNRGGFKDVVFNQDLLKYRDYFNQATYDAYGYGDKAHLIYRNETAPINQKVLVIGDSFANIPSVFLPLCFKNFEQLDMRYFKDDFPQYYDEYSPDVLIMINCVSTNEQINYEYFPE